MSWGIALEKQVETLNGLNQAALHERDLAEFLGEPRPRVASVVRDMLRRACQGEAIYVEPEIVRLLTAEAPHVPDDWLLTADLIVAAPAFCWLGEPAGFARMVDGAQLPISGFTWAVTADDEGKPGLSGTALTERTSAWPTPYVLAWFGWGWGTTLGQREQWLIANRNKGHETDENWSRELSYFAALTEFMSQKIVERKRLPPSRATRRRLTLSGMDIPLVTVVTLRRKHYGAARPGEGTREFSHRWIVRSHWRRQWYAKLGIHQPRLIAAYVKGPEQKPLVLKRHIFDVAR